ncbi:MAG: DNA-directed RNA polymerase subunit alpha [Planctomycetes bacterium]|nr:DNA-directed RNA polymerase subunit alpha [Planctomycetota bacterium]HJO27779.1 DNA-directed RNA polymerase subunit alpha [Planctomycetota bacterium]
MRIRWRNFELPSKVNAEPGSRTEEYGKFLIEPFERGFGHTIGNGLRRVLLSSIEGAAIRSVKIAGATHEFDTLEGVYEDVSDIILNLKRLRIRHDGEGTLTCRIEKTGPCEVTGADVICEGDAEVCNKDLRIATLTSEVELNIELTGERGRGYLPADAERGEGEELTTIPVDAIFSPVQRVRYAIEATRVGKFTNYDRLALEIWTDGTVTPELALVEAAKIYRKHLNPFVLFGTSVDADPVVEEPSASEFNQERVEVNELGLLLDQSISELELSVRARNCLDGANLTTLGALVALSENEVMHLKNLGKTSLTEIKSKLAEKGLSLGMTAQ